MPAPAGGCQRGSPVPASPYVICLDDAGRAELEAASRRATAPFRLVLRARIVLLAAAGAGTAAIAARLGICEDTARKWRRRYCEQGLDGLADAPRPGRPRAFPAAVVAEVKALACELPAASGKPLARWTCPELARQAAAARHRRRGLGVHGAPLARRRRDQALAAPVVDLPPRPALRRSRPAASWTSTSGNGKESRSATTSTCSARTRSPASRPAAASTSRCPPGPGRATRVESEYIRGGTLAYLAAYDVHRAQVMGRCEPTTGIKPFTALVDQVMSDRAVRLGEAGLLGRGQRLGHRGQAAIDRLARAHPNAIMVHTPVHASWLNQIPVNRPSARRHARVS